eukprot:m.85482 g.85482  ORF g.85482 m.85482 type:complete len:401 (-) comp17882_c0_seq3:38-1240(-)
MTEEKEQEFLKQLALAKRASARRRLKPIAFKPQKQLVAAELPGEGLFLICRQVEHKRPHTEEESLTDWLHAVAPVIGTCFAAFRKHKPYKFRLEEDLNHDTGMPLPTTPSTPLDGLRVHARVHTEVNAVTSKPLAPPCTARYTVHAASDQGKRSYNEDRLVMFPNLQAVLGIPAAENHGFFAVLDGHGGADAVRYAEAQVPGRLLLHEQLFSSPVRALREAIAAVDKGYLDTKGASGTTVAALLLAPSRAYVAWLGDSQVVLCREGRCVHVMEPHKPTRLDERIRIERLGGQVVDVYGVLRVEAQLAVSRSVGDRQLKKYVIGVPDVAQIELKGTEDFVLLASDGLWDCITPYEAVEFVKQHEPDFDSADALVHLALQKGVKDNVSVLVIHFPKTKQDEP